MVQTVRYKKISIFNSPWFLRLECSCMTEHRKGNSRYVTCKPSYHRRTYWPAGCRTGRRRTASRRHQDCETAWTPSPMTTRHHDLASSDPLPSNAHAAVHDYVSTINIVYREFSNKLKWYRRSLQQRFVFQSTRWSRLNAPVSLQQTSVFYGNR